MAIPGLELLIYRRTRYPTWTEPLKWMDSRSASDLKFPLPPITSSPKWDRSGGWGFPENPLPRWARCVSSYISQDIKIAVAGQPSIRHESRADEKGHPAIPPLYPSGHNPFPRKHEAHPFRSYESQCFGRNEKHPHTQKRLEYRPKQVGNGPWRRPGPNGSRW